MASNESDRGLTVSEFAERHSAIIAVNADYFDESLQPVGLAIGSCGRWAEPATVRRQPILAIGERRAEIIAPIQAGDPVGHWTRGAVSGWPQLVRDCRALSSEELPGSDHFTRAVHPRTAVAISEDGARLFLVVADGRSTTARGMTLPELGTFIRERLKACEALNLDGGGSTEMVIRGRIVNQPSDGSERKVGNHLAIVPAGYEPPCE